jgi:hypothetical protein
MLRIALAIAGDARHRPLKPFACGNAGLAGELVVTNSCAFYTLHTRLRVRLAPGIPHALSGRKVFGSPGRKAVAGREGARLHSRRHSGARVSASYGAQLRT